MILFHESTQETRRLRLDNLLKGAMHRRLTVVSGVPGIGKSTIIESFSQSIDSPCLVYYFEEGSDSISYFLDRAIQFINSVYSVNIHNFKEGLDPEKHIQELLEVILSSDQDQDLFIIIDNYFANSDDDSFHNFFQLFINTLPHNVHFIVTTVEKIRWDKLKSMIYRSILIISNEQLYFTEEEMEDFYKKSYDLDLDEEEIQHLYSFTGGWTIAVEAIGEKMLFEPEFMSLLKKDHIDAARRLIQLDNYLENKFLSKLTEEQKEVLYATSVIQEFSEEMAILLIGEEKIKLLDELCNSSNLIRYCMTNPKFYKTNRVWQCLIYNRAHEVLGYNRIAELHEKIGDYFFEQKNWKEAIHHFIESQNINKAMEILKQAGSKVLTPVISKKFYSLLKKLPLEQLEENPWFQFGYACYLKSKDPELCNYYLDCALERFRRNNDIIGVSQALFIKAEIIIFYGNGGLGKMNIFINDPDLYSESNNVIDSRIWAYKQIYAGWTHNFYTGNYPEAVNCGEKARRTSLVLQDINLYIWSCWILGNAYAFVGEFDLAKGYIKDALGRIYEPGVDPSLTMMIPHLAGCNAEMSGDFKTAIEWLNLAIKIQKQKEITIWNFYSKFFLINSLDYLGDFEKADQVLDEMKAVVLTYFKEENYHLRSYYLATQAKHAFLTGKIPRALNFAQQSYELRKKAGGEIYCIRCQIILGAIYRELGSYMDAETILLEALEKSVACSTPYFEASTYVELALLYAAKGDKKHLNIFLEKGLRLAMEKTFYHFYTWRDDNIVKLLSLIEDASPFEGYLEDLVEYRGLHIIQEKDTKKPIQIETVSNNYDNPEKAEPALKLYLMGPFSMEIKGVRTKNFSSRKALYMLKMLGTKNEAISVQKLIEEMWDNWDGRSVMNNFYFTLHQLRKILGDKNSVIFKDGLCMLDPNLYWSDVSLFKYLLDKAEEAIKDSQEKEALDFLHQGIALYRGEYLEGESLGESLLLEREYIERKYYGALLNKARILLKLNEFDKVVEIIQKAQQSSFIDEDAYRVLMIAYYVQGKLKHATDIYKKLKNRLQLELGVAPHVITTTLYNRISGGDDSKDILDWLLHA